MRRLMVEDKAGAALLTVSIIKNLGFEVVHTAASIEDAIFKSQSLSPDLILLDSYGETKS